MPGRVTRLVWLPKLPWLTAASSWQDSKAWAAVGTYALENLYKGQSYQHYCAQRTRTACTLRSADRDPAGFVCCDTRHYRNRCVVCPERWNGPTAGAHNGFPRSVLCRSIGRQREVGSGNGQIR